MNNHKPDNHQPESQEPSQSPQARKSSGPSPTVNPSYQRAEPFVITESVRREIQAAFAEIDMAQVRIMRTKTPAEKFQMAVSMIAAAEQAGVYQLRLREPHLSEEDALRIVRGGILNHVRDKHRR
jgi:hypothetical protein